MLKLGWKGLRKQIADATGAAEPPASSEASTSASSSSNGEASGSNSWANWANKARKLVVDNAKAAYDAVPQADAEGSATSDAERGEGPDAMAQLNKLGNWAKAMGSKVSEKAKSLELGEQTKGLQHSVSKGFGRVAENAAAASGNMQEKGKMMAKDLGGKSMEKLEQAKAASKEAGKAAKEKASQAAAGAKGAISQAGQSLGGLSALTMSPAKLAQFAGVAFVGIFLISTSFTFLPVFVIAPQKFALLFAFGSMTLLGSLTILKGPQAFAASIIERKKLPFTVAYFVGLVGTLIATIGMKSFILTAVFGIIQALALLYFLASYVPGGKALLNCCGKCCKKSARAVGGRFLRT